jgi:hypothetical protein
MTPNPIAPPGSMLRIAALLAVLGATLATGPAQAQLGAIFGDSPPRPPADVPNRPIPAQPPPVQCPGQAPLQASPAGPPPSSIHSRPLPPSPGATMAPPPAQRVRVGSPATGPLPEPANPPPPQPADTAPRPDDTVITEMPTQKIENSRAIFSGLDKITGRIISFDAAIGETVQFGALQVTARVCYTRPPTEATNTDAFVQVDEVTLQGEVRRIFSGWMFVASPGLHAVEHPIYDVWLTDCSSPIKVAEPAVQPTPAATTPASRPAPPSRPRQTPPARQQPAPPVAPTQAAPAPAAPAQPH